MTSLITAAATYVPINREELEEWLDSIGFRGKWDRDARYAGIYFLKFSPVVAVKLSSTIGSDNDARGSGQASMQLALISLVTGRVLNKKAQGQSHFKRTIGWKKTWASGVETMKKAYLASSDFYEVIAGIEDREKYKAEILALIEKVPGWRNDNTLISFHRKVEGNGVVMPREMDYITEAAARQTKGPDPRDEVNEAEVSRDLRMEALRKLWVSAKRSNDDWTMGFAHDIAHKFVSSDRRLSDAQLKIIRDKLHQYRIPDPDGNPAYELF